MSNLKCELCNQDFGFSMYIVQTPNGMVHADCALDLEFTGVIQLGLFNADDYRDSTLGGLWQ